jgi:hypothetical protein
VSDTTSPAGVEAPEEEKVDEALEDTFPASDPPATGGSTGPNDA